ncbi:DMT family transporter [Xanthobacter autotrophicus]|uniref:DMT family transporter n=1 Tax=Xanthobacter autotrophicus TaxID=280 RepID=UPI001E36FCCD|nr:DMT family transporter [Xanthobacter autotrophicus]UDQ90813.1 DMT family transporter [Xanthobacter autotrophicus]
MDRRLALGLLLGFVAVVMFGATLPLTRFALHDFSPWFISFGRAALAGFAALGLVLVMRRPWPFGQRAVLWRLAVSSGCLIFVFPLAIGVATQTVPAAHGGIVLGLLPLCTAIAAMLLAGERPGLGLFAASAVGAGLVVAFALRNGAGGALGMGDSLLFLGVIACAIGYAVSGGLARTMSGWEVIAFMLILCLPVTLPLALLTFPWGGAGTVAGASWAALLYLGLFSQLIGFFFWNAGLAMGGIARVGQMQLLQTFVTVGLAWPINGEVPDAETVAFAAGVALVVAVAQRTRSRPR